MRYVQTEQCLFSLLLNSRVRYIKRNVLSRTTLKKWNFPARESELLFRSFFRKLLGGGGGGWYINQIEPLCFRHRTAYHFCEQLFIARRTKSPRSPNGPRQPRVYLFVEKGRAPLPRDLPRGDRAIVFSLGPI